MRKHPLTLLLLTLSVAITGCATPSAVSPESAEAVSKIQSGHAKGEVGKKSLQPALSGSYMGDANSENTSVESNVQRAATTSGHLQTGFSFAATMSSFQSALEEAAKASPTMRALQQQLERQLASEPANDAAVAETIEKIRAEEKSLREALSRAGGDLSNLTNLTQVFMMYQSTGHDGPVSDAQAKEIGTQITETVKALRDT